MPRTRHTTPSPKDSTDTDQVAREPQQLALGAVDDVVSSVASSLPLSQLGPQSSAAIKPPTKLALVRSLLAREAGATLSEMQEATGWQAHSVRAALTGLRKTGDAIERRRDTAGGSRYRMAHQAIEVAVPPESGSTGTGSEPLP